MSRGQRTRNSHLYFAQALPFAFRRADLASDDARVALLGALLQLGLPLALRLLRRGCLCRCGTGASAASCAAVEARHEVEQRAQRVGAAEDEGHEELLREDGWRLSPLAQGYRESQPTV